jgi:hypothetical protein
MNKTTLKRRGFVPRLRMTICRVLPKGHAATVEGVPGPGGGMILLGTMGAPAAAVVT